MYGLAEFPVKNREDRNSERAWGNAVDDINPALP